jgi:chromosome partitioning protein
VTALVNSDLALIPLKPSAADVAGAVATYDLIQELNKTPERAGKPISVAMVLTMTMKTLIARRQAAT